MRKSFSFLLFLLLSHVLLAQQQSINGKIFSQSSKYPLAFATVSLINNKDSSILFVTVSDTTGRFSMPVLATGQLTLSVSYAGFVPLWKNIFLTNGQSLPLDSLFLREISPLDSVLLIAKRPPVEIINDTLQFNTENYKTPPNAVVEDMLKRMPGITVDKDGNIRFNGKSVRRVQVNGKELFMGNPKMATQNFNADWVDKVQVFERKSDRAQFTGMDDGQTETTVNLVLKKDKLKAVFGRTSAAAGTQDRFDAQSIVNRFTTDKQRSFVAMANNTNRQGFALSDMMSFNQSMFTSGPTMINAGDFGLPVSDLGNQQQGIANTYAGGININESWKKKTDLNASVQMSNIQLVTQRNSLRNNLLPGNNFTYQSDGDNERTTKQQRFNATIDHKIDEFHSVRVTPQLTLQQESQRLFNDFKSFTTSNDLLNSGFTQRNNQSQKVLFNNNVLLRKRFKKKGRTISSTLIFGYNQDKNNGELKTENSFYTAAQATRDSVFSQQNKAQTWASQFNGSITYTEKLGRRTLLEWTNYYVTNNGKSNRQTLDFNLQSGKFDIPNPSLTNNFSFQQEQKGTTFRLRSNFKRINASIATSAQLSSLVSENKSVASLLKQSFSDLLPSAGLRYAMNSKTSIVVNYITSLKMPTSIELQPVADFSDPLNIYKGNPDLKRSYIHHITANITTLNLPRGRNVFVMASLNKIDNAIVQSDMINASGQRVTTPVNVSGLVNALLSFNSGFAIRSIKSTINLGVGITHNESLSFVNGVKNKMISKGLSPSLNWNLNIDKKFILYASGRWNISKATYSLQTKLNNRFLQQVYSIETTNYLPANISITNNISYTINSGRFFGYNTKIPFWTANVSKSFLKNNRGEIKVTVYDILNQNVGINRIANQQFVEDVRYNVLKRYFTLSILYILNKSGKNAGGVIIQTQ